MESPAIFDRKLLKEARNLIRKEEITTKAIISRPNIPHLLS
jgi:hypothetical protein